MLYGTQLDCSIARRALAGGQSNRTVAARQRAVRSFQELMAGGIFCIENWAPDLRNRETVRPLLDYLESREAARVVHQRVDTEREPGTTCLVSRPLGAIGWRTLPCTGSAGGQVWVGSTQLTLDTLTRWERLDARERDQTRGDEGDWHLDLGGKAVHLGSCSSLRVSPSRLSSFRAATDAAAICGYTREVAWIDAGAADLLILAALAHAADGTRRNFSQALRSLGRRAATTLDALGSYPIPTGAVPPARSLGARLISLLTPLG